MPGNRAILCRELMTANPPTLAASDTVGRAVDLLREHRYLAIPVVDAAGRYLGMFAKSRLFGLMLPPSVALEESLPNIARLTQLAYLPTDLGELRQRYAAYRQRAVIEFADASVPTLRPDQPIMAVMLLIYRTRNFVPVVDPTSGRLEGVISTWDILTMLDEAAGE